MASTKEIKRRIKSVKNTKKITKAMELIAASKMKKAVSQTLASRLYAEYSWDLLTSLSVKLEDTSHPFFEINKKANKNLIILITSNRGLCGGYNSQVIKKVIALLKDYVSSRTALRETINFDIIAIGKKGDSAMRRLARSDGSGVGQSIIASFTEMPDSNTKLYDIMPVATMVTNEFKNKHYQNIYVAYTDFVSALNQKPHIKKLLPVSKEELKEVIEATNPKEKPLETTNQPYLLEGDIYKLLEILAEKLVQMQIYQMFLESNASEQSSRMVAMKNANEAAGDMINDLTLVFNKARQASITREISEISAGMASVE